MYQSRNLNIRYDFSAIDADILGNIYEQYLGHILKKTEKRAKITNGTAHRKDQGIYYTPTHVVRFIVNNTLGEKLKKKKVNVDELKILDPTCGSGSFLLKAFDTLSEFIAKKEGKIQQSKLDYDKTSVFLKRKTELLKNTIFGVDLDVKAVEITQLNLLLKLAEKRHRLPTLRNNIKSGNSLIKGGELELKPYFGDEWKKKTPFNWNEEFNIILNNGGFDIIIGNPPYVHQKGTPDDPTISLEDRKYYRENYETIFKEGVKTIGGVKLNLFMPYVERCIHLLKEDGLMGFIVHKNLLKVASYKFLREFILDNCVVKIIVDLEADVFEEVTGETIIIILQKCSSKRKRDNNTIKIFYDLNKKEDLISNNYNVNTIKQKYFYENADSIFSIYVDQSFSELKNKMEKDSFKLVDVANIVSFGLNTSDNKKYFIEEKIDENYKNAVMGRDIDKWIIKNKNKFVYYHEDVLTRKGDEEAFLSDEKLILQRVGSDLKCAYDNEKIYCFNSTNMILPKKKEFSLKYILALLNSKLINEYYKTVFSTKSNLTVNVTQGYLSQLPIKSITPKKQLEIIEIADKIIGIKNKLKEMEEKTTDEKDNLENELTKLNNNLNKEIYSIYGLSEDEIKLIEM